MLSFVPSCFAVSIEQVLITENLSLHNNYYRHCRDGYTLFEFGNTSGIDIINL